MKRVLAVLGLVGSLMTSWYLVETPHPGLANNYAVVDGPYYYATCMLRAAYYHGTGSSYVYSCVEDSDLQ